ncbi:unnamed protein product [Gongylonema pulchrum]|uniref:CRM1_C domain-containing protein n=1 Tax=Gongylonema pulchrum TaxID=637853 RepID=A0A183D5P0_9BILA|nr:unnamed protein product [Gongylonema pulchrum]
MVGVTIRDHSSQILHQIGDMLNIVVATQESKTELAGHVIRLYRQGYRRVKEKQPLVETMTVLMPMLLERLVTLMPDASQESCLLQKLILKIFFGLVQVVISASFYFVIL